MMPIIDHSKLDALYIEYGFKPVEIQNVKIYEYKHGRYFGVDVIDDGGANIQNILDMYASQGFSTARKCYKDFDSAEDDLYKGFFQIDNRRKDGLKKYEKFRESQLKGLSEGAKYSYINCKFNILHFDNDNAICQMGESESDNVIDRISKELQRAIMEKTPMLTIIEAAAGFGKTCTAYELVKRISESDDFSDIIPLYIELSRNREARIFKHILQNEIERQFQNAITSKVVERQIQRGKVIVLIDGFDELLSKEMLSEKELQRDVESMLTTIFNLLKYKAQVVITSRKTVMLSGDGFQNSLLRRKTPFNVLRITLAEPNINDWLDYTQRQILSSAGVSIENIANPAVLSYLRSMPETELKKLTAKSNIADVYMDYLCRRERIRQNIDMLYEVQLRIFLKLTRMMCELDINAGERSFIKSLILDYNSHLFDEYINNIQEDTKFTQEELADTLTNHALLDRRDNDNIGFINDFVFGTLIGMNLETGKFQLHHNNPENILSQTFASLAVEAYKEQTASHRKALWSVFHNLSFNYDSSFDFTKDYYLLNEIKEQIFTDFIIDDLKINNLKFIIPASFEKGIFTNCTFTNCNFDIRCFHNTSFTNCIFYNCHWVSKPHQEGVENVMMAGCEANNDFYSCLLETNKEKGDNQTTQVNYEELILSLFVRDKITGMKRLQAIKEELCKYPSKNIDTALSKMKTNGLVNISGGNCFIRKEGISIFRKKYQKINYVCESL